MQTQVFEIGEGRGDYRKVMVMALFILFGMFVSIQAQAEIHRGMKKMV